MTRTMHNRLFMICTGTLYFGAMLAGLAGSGWAVVPAFVALFFFWLVALRPGLFPATLSGLRDRAARQAIARWLLAQLALVVFCFALGRGIGGVAGSLPHLPLALTLGLSFLALPVARLLQGPTA